MTATANLSASRAHRAGATTAEQRGAWAGLAFVASVIASAFLPGVPPAADASGAKIASYFGDHATGIKAAQLVGAFGVIALLWWFGSLWRTLSRAEGERPRLAIIAAASFAIGVTLALLSGAINGAAAIRVHALGTGIQALFALSITVVSLAGLAISVFLAAICILNSRAAMFPRWTDYVGWLAAISFLIGISGLVSANNLGNVFNTIAPIVWCVWIVGVSLSMARRAGLEA